MLETSEKVRKIADNQVWKCAKADYEQNMNCQKKMRRIYGISRKLYALFFLRLKLFKRYLNDIQKVHK